MDHRERVLLEESVRERMTSPLIETSREEIDYFKSEKIRKAEHSFNETVYGDLLPSTLTKQKYTTVNPEQKPLLDKSSNNTRMIPQNSYILLSKDNQNKITENNDVSSNHSGSGDQSDSEVQNNQSNILGNVASSMNELRQLLCNLKLSDIGALKLGDQDNFLVKSSNKQVKPANKVNMSETYQLVPTNENNVTSVQDSINEYLSNISKEVELFKKEYNDSFNELKQNYANVVKFSKLTEEENELLKIKIKSYDKYVDESVKYNMMINNPTYVLYTRLTKYKSLVPGIYDKFNNMLDDFDKLEIDNTELTDYSKVDKDIKECLFKNEQKFNKPSLIHERCEWVNSEEEMVANLPLFKINRYIEYTVLAKSNIGCVMAGNGVFLRNDNSSINEFIDLPKMKYSSHLVGFKVVLKESVLTENVNKLKFVLYSGNADVQSFTYNINSKDDFKSLVSPRFNLPDRLVDENLSVVSKGIQFSSKDINSISVDSRYVRDIYCFYRINSSVIPNSFRNLNLQEKYKFKSQKVYNIFIRSYNELQDAAMNNRLDIVKWIMYGDEYDLVCEKYNNIKLSDIDVEADDYDEKNKKLEDKKNDLKKLLYMYYDNNVVDKNPTLRFEFVLKQALENKAHDVAYFLLIELIDHLDHKVSSDSIFASASKGADIKCVKIVLRYIDYMKAKSEEEEEHLSNKRSSVKHQDLYHDSLLNDLTILNKPKI